MKRANRPLKRWGRFACLGGVLCLAGLWGLPWLLPWPPGLEEGVAASPVFEDCEGRPLRRLLDKDGQGRRVRVVSFDGLPSVLVAATVAVEDKRFFSHGGVDYWATMRALKDGLTSRRVVSGASTITQQLVKVSSHYPDRRRTVGRKLREILLARRVEMTWSKARILEAYLNRIDYGNGHRGCVSAANGYFGKPLSDLSLAEAAFLAGLPQSPSRLNPYRHFERAKARQQEVLRRLAQQGDARMAERVRRAHEEALALCPRGQLFEAPHFVERLLAQGVAPQRTTLDLEIQRQAEDALQRGLATLGDPRIHGAVVVIDNESSGVRAWVGSRDYASPHGGQVDGAWALRSPGSALKPFTYAIALESGYHPVSLLEDVPTEYMTPTGLYRPVNYHRRYSGPVLLKEALGNSLNVPAVRLLQELGGADVLLEALRSLGLTSLTESADHYGLGLTIGNAPVRLVELTNAYRALAQQGVAKPYRSLLSEGTADQDRPVFSRETAYLLADGLSDNRTRWREFGRRSALAFPYPVACKTGTSSDYRDAWAFGVTPDFTVGVWVGRMDGRPMQEVNSLRGAAPVLRDLVDALTMERGPSEFKRPDGMVRVVVDRRTGKRLDGRLRERWKAQALETWCDAAKLPAVAEPADYDSRGRVRLGAEFAAWLTGQGASWQHRYAVAPSLEEAAVVPLRIEFPLPGTVLYLDPGLPDGGRRLSPKASPDAELRWHSPTLTVEESGRTTDIWLEEGRHELRAENACGDAATTWVTVRKL